MSRYRIQRAARQDLRDIYRYIARDNRTAAAGLLERFYEHFRFLAANPLAGELRTGFGPTVRLFSVGNYAIVYRPENFGFTFAHIVHGARDLDALLKEPKD